MQTDSSGGTLLAICHMPTTTPAIMGLFSLLYSRLFLPPSLPPSLPPQASFDLLKPPSGLVEEKRDFFLQDKSSLPSLSIPPWSRDARWTFSKPNEKMIFLNRPPPKKKLLKQWKIRDLDFFCPLFLGYLSHHGPLIGFI